MSQVYTILLELGLVCVWSCVLYLLYRFNRPVNIRAKLAGHMKATTTTRATPPLPSSPPLPEPEERLMAQIEEFEEEEELPCESELGKHEIKKDK